jgi:aminoglycoside phosphotransferase family enzyme
MADYSKEITTASFPEKPKELSTIETLISKLYFVGDFVYKTKKPVNLGFCDFSTLKLRKKFCFEELKKNKILSGGLYLGVVPVRTEIGKPAIFNGKMGVVVDYAVKMRRLAESDKFSNLTGVPISARVIESLAENLGKFHETLKAQRSFWGPNRVRFFCNQNFLQMSEYVPGDLPKDLFNSVKTSTLEYLNNHQDLITERVRSGRVKDGHGDLHTGNIFLVKRGGTRVPIIFDSLEFNKDLSCCDVAAELAFLSMDLKFHGRQDLAKLFIGCYLRKSHDLEMVKTGLLDFYESYRACVRAKIAIMSKGGAKSKSRKTELVLEACQYLKLASQTVYNSLHKSFYE